MGKGIYGMKPLGGGHLIGQVEESFNFVKKHPLYSFFCYWYAIKRRGRL